MLGTVIGTDGAVMINYYEWVFSNYPVLLSMCKVTWKQIPVRLGKNIMLQKSISIGHWNESLRGLNNPRGQGENDAIVGGVEVTTASQPTGIFKPRRRVQWSNRLRTAAWRAQFRLVFSIVRPVTQLALPARI